MTMATAASAVARGIARVTEKPAARALSSASRAHAHAHSSGLAAAASTGARATVVAAEDPLNLRSLAVVASAMAAAAGLAALTTVDDSTARSETKRTNSVGGAALLTLPGGAVAGGEDTPPASLVADEPAKPRGRRNLLKSRTRHKAKLEEVDLMMIHLDEYRKARTAIDSLPSRFEHYASKTAESNGANVPAMTFTDFVHSLILPRFHTRSPHPDHEYTCEFVGNANGLITFEECYLLIHLLQIPKEHFDVAFCMFDLDGDGAVGKDEFCHVIENVLRAISVKEGDAAITISAEDTLPRLTKYLFGRYGKKTIRAAELDAALDLLRKQILKAEFDLYARPHPKNKSVEVISVHDFAISLISCFDPDRLPPYLERVQSLNASNELVTWEDFYKFHFNVQSNLQDIKLAFDLTGAAEITETDFIRAAHVVSGVELSFPVVQLAFRVFDSNDNGTLDQSELLKVLEMRNNIELKERLPNSKFKRFWQCAKGGAQ